MTGDRTDLFGELIVDSFAGGGGASTGIELATGRPVDIAINHDRAAILMHRTNHPYTTHYQEDVWDVDPVKVCRGRRVGLLWASPDCKHFSRAKGAALVDRNIRGLAWVVLRWAGTVRPRVIILENVPEFQTWGPVRRGKPIRSRSGTTFRRWLGQLRALSYDVDWRELTAADYGAPTTRRRLVLAARCDGRPIVWPEPTHSRDGGGGRGKWVPAADIIDWSRPCFSIFATKRELKEQYGITAVRPLADNTLRRIIRGVDKFTIRSGKPYIVSTNTGDRAEHPSDGSAGGSRLSAVELIQYHTEQGEAVRGQSMDAPLHTVDASNRYALASASLVEYFGAGRALDVSEPLHTVTSHDREALVLAHLAEFKGQDIGQSMDRPLRTVTASAGEFAECRTILVKSDGRDLHHWPEVRALLVRFCGYALTEDDVLLLDFGGTAYYIADILLRMLTPRELYRAMGFPPDYIIDRDHTGRPYPKSAQVARCGNAVCPPMAAAMVRANFPE